MGKRTRADQIVWDGTSQGVRGPESGNLGNGLTVRGSWEGLVRNVNSFVIEMEITLGGRDSTQEEGQEEGQGV